jgi:hypothetical protein
MKRAAFRAIVCCVALLASTAGAAADPASDRDMANRLTQAAQSGDDDAAFYVGALYSAGVGVPQSDEESFRWFKRAADQGHSHAMLVLSGVYAIGRGAPRDNVKAYQYAYIVNSASKVEEWRHDSRQLMGLLETRMTPDDVNRARNDAYRWRATGRPGQATVPTVPPPPSPMTSNPPPPPQMTSNPPAAPANTTPQQPPPPATATPVADDFPKLKPEDFPKKSDLDDLLNQMPPALRKKFGF